MYRSAHESTACPEGQARISSLGFIGFWGEVCQHLVRTSIPHFSALSVPPSLNLKEPCMSRVLELFMAFLVLESLMTVLTALKPCEPKDKASPRLQDDPDLMQLCASCLGTEFWVLAR